MQSVEESVSLNAGHYEIALLFRDRQLLVPNHRLQAEQRAAWLKRKLEKCPKLLDDFKGFVEDIFAKGYARKVGPHQKESNFQGKTWFIPYHGLITLIRLGKFVSSSTVKRRSKENP